MLEEVLSHRPNTARRLRASAAGPIVDDYVGWLTKRRYKRSTQSLYLHALARYCVWMAEHGHDIGEDAVAVLAAHRTDQQRLGVLRRVGGKTAGKLRGDLSQARTFTEFLVESGIAKAPPPRATIGDRHPLLGEFATWMEHHRGNLRSSIRVYLVVLERLVLALGDDPKAYTATALRSFVLSEGGKFGVERASTITIATRGFVRFLVATGRSPAGRDAAIPFPANWNLSSLPAYIDATEVEKVLTACPVSPNGVRDRAILVLLARLGLRAGEIANLRFSDIDWTTGELRVVGKGRRESWLPLPQEVGDAILAYLRDVRPTTPGDDHVFLRFLAPYRGLGMEAVAAVAKLALDRAGVVALRKGTHVFRHSLATSMLRNGVSLEGVGAVLRHRSPETTAHYAKVDHGMLIEIAQPWPGSAP